MGLKKRAAVLLTAGAIAAGGALPFAPAAMAGHPPASHLHAGEYCTKKYQHFYHRHGYTCKKASDGALRLFTR